LTLAKRRRVYCRKPGNHNGAALVGRKMTELREIFSKMVEEESSDLCPVGRLLTKFDEETKTVFIMVLASSASTRDIHSELIKAGYKIGRDTLGSHRNNWCRCKGYNDDGTK
jgi:hypothetical protein